MTSSQYNNIIQWTLSAQSLDGQEKPVPAAKEIFDNCGVEFPSGNGEAVRAVLKGNDYIAWRSCTAEEAQQYANEGKAAVGICGEQIIVIKPEKEWVPIKSTFDDTKVEKGLVDTVSEMAAEEIKNTAFFAYSASGTGVIVPAPLVFVKVESSPGTLTESEKGCNAAFIFNYLLGHGFTEQAACGVLGNIERESGVNPGVWQVWHNTTVCGYGLVQWSPASDFLVWAAGQGYIAGATADYIDNLAIKEPLKLMNAELVYLVDYCGTRWIIPKGNNINHTGKSVKSYDEYKKLTWDVYTLALVFHDHYERSKDDESKIKQRGAYAQKWAKFFDI